jgi:DNA-binding response OmpR family regulator
MKSKGSILIVDDEKGQRDILNLILKKEGYDVDVALDGYEGIKLARGLKPDLILLDIMMPGLDGYEVCRRLKADPDTAKIEVIMLTAKGNVGGNIPDDDVAARGVREQWQGFEAGATEWLTKPVKARDLLQRVKTVLWAAGFAP